MKTLLVISCLVVACCALPQIIQDWNSFKEEHGKAYSNPKEDRQRFEVYLTNKQMIEEHNKKYEAGQVSYKLKINHFGDMLPREISALLNGFNRTGEASGRRGALKFEAPPNWSGLQAPAALDWRQKGAVTQVKDQGKCGSCWAFSTTGSIEGQTFLKTGKLVSLSEQNLMDCSVDYGNEGCQGGLMVNAFQYVIDNGITTEDSYPYEEMEDDCRSDKSKVAARIRDYVEIPADDEEALLKAVATVGPISVAINAGQNGFTFYDQGVYNDKGCDATLNHGVLLVGYGKENGADYWLVKNSWGTAWGQQGYIKMARNKGNLCGIASMASYPLV